MFELLLGKVLAFGWEWIGTIATGGAVVAAAVAAAVPGALKAIGETITGTIDAVGRFLAVVEKSPLTAFLLGAVMLWPAGYIMGVARDAPMRERARVAAVNKANAHADSAIAEIRADYARKLAALQKPAPATANPPRRGGR